MTDPAKLQAIGAIEELKPQIEDAKEKRNRLIDRLVDSLNRLRDDSAGYTHDCDASQVADAARRITEAQRALMDLVNERNAHADRANRPRLVTRAIVIA